MSRRGRSSLEEASDEIEALVGAIGAIAEMERDSLETSDDKAKSSPEGRMRELRASLLEEAAEALSTALAAVNAVVMPGG